MYLGKRSAIGSVFDLEGHDFVLFASDGGDEVWALDGPKGMVEIRANGRLAVKGPHAELSAALSDWGSPCCQTP
ncbi:hypothetical protein X737_34310 [Mesorhizobium sp. L48C026A00]|nr:hypothetical protein X737_34310 [Mesorhizobium sp. L48C026A00]